MPVFNFMTFSLGFLILPFLYFIFLQGAEEPDAFSIERERLAAECKAIK